MNSKHHNNDNSKNEEKRENEEIIIKEAYNKKIIELKNEIKNLGEEIKENKESGIKYYLNILKKGTDNRNTGLSWIIKRLLSFPFLTVIILN